MYRTIVEALTSLLLIFIKHDMRLSASVIYKLL